MLRGRYKAGGFWLVVKVGQTRVRLDWRQRLEVDGWAITQTTVKSWSCDSVGPIKERFEKSWTH